MTREEAIDMLHGIRADNLNLDDAYTKDKYDALDMAIKALEQEPKTGHWVDDKCSICGKGIEDLIDSREWYKNETPNYCPFCGKRVLESEVSDADKDNCNTCIHHKPDNPYCECCFDLDKYEKEDNNGN